LTLGEYSLLEEALPLSSSTVQYSAFDKEAFSVCLCDSSWPVGLDDGETQVAEVINMVLI